MICNTSFNTKIDQKMTSKSFFNSSQNGKKIGLLGGSFNPAHDGHVAISLFAMKRLKLDEIWWLVSPQNPLKSKENMDSLDKRLAFAKALVAPHKDIIVTDLERTIQTVHTIDTLRAIKARWKGNFFVWLMGEDNLSSVHLWKSWQEIFSLLPIAVFRRSGYSLACQRSQAEALFAQAECPLASVEELAVSPPPAWVVLDNELNPASATQIRKTSRPT